MSVYTRCNKVGVFNNIFNYKNIHVQIFITYFPIFRRYISLKLYHFYDTLKARTVITFTRSFPRVITI